MRNGHDNHANPSGDTLRRAKATGGAAAMDAAPNRRPHFTGGEVFKAALLRRYEKRQAEIKGQRAAEVAAAEERDWMLMVSLAKRHTRLYLRAEALWDAAMPGWGRTSVSSMLPPIMAGREAA